MARKRLLYLLLFIETNSTAVKFNFMHGKSGVKQYCLTPLMEVLPRSTVYGNVRRMSSRLMMYDVRCHRIGNNCISSFFE